LGTLSPRFKDVDERFEVYFDLASEKFINPRRGVVPPRAMPVREALETKSLLNWLRLHEADLESQDFDVADRLGGVFRDYKVPVYVVTGDDQSILREVFDRVNSAGKPISRAQVFHALFASEENPGSPASVVTALRATGFGLMQENRVVQSLLGIRGGDVQRDIREEFSNGEDPVDWYDKTEEALSRAIQFLRNEGIHHLYLMPNTMPLPVLATFFFVHPDPGPWNLRLLARWLWRGWVHGFGKEGGQTPVLRRAIRSIYPNKDKIEEVPDEYDAVKSLLEYVPDRAADTVSLTDFRTDRAQSRLVLLALASLNPLNVHGQHVDIAQLYNSRGVDAVSEFVKGHRTDAAARGFWPTDSPPIIEVSDRRILDSHAISPKAEEALRSGNPDLFLNHRRDMLREIVRDFLLNRLEVDSILRRPLDDLLVEGSEED
jgi:hypothetical protein